jgi:Icc-related predicted phosphoesterase
MSLIWTTDLHLNFCSDAVIREFLNDIKAGEPSALLIGGDIGEADSFDGYLKQFSEDLRIPIYFVLGNHDAYHGSIAEVRRKAAALTKESDWLHWLPEAGVVEITPEVGLIGHGGWGDGRLGSYHSSSVRLNDFVLISELKGLGPTGLLNKLTELGDEAAAHFEKILPEALNRFKTVLVLTHVPPYVEACWHEGETSGPDWSPFFACWATGMVLKEAMEARPDQEMLVLCGHTHSPGEADILPNLKVLTGGARYCSPEIQKTFDNTELCQVD